MPRAWDENGNPITTPTAVVAAPRAWDENGNPVSAAGSPPGVPKPPLPAGLTGPMAGEENSIGGAGNEPGLPAIVNQGLHQLGHAIPAFANSWKRGASDVIEGTEKTLSPLAIPALLAAPATTIAGFAGGTGGGMAGRAMAKSAGASPETSDLIGDIAGIAGGGAGGAAGALGSRAARPLFRLNPGVAVNKVWRPQPGETNFPSVTPSAVSEIKTFAGQPRGNADITAGIQPTIEAHQRALEGYLDRARELGTRIPGDSIVQSAARAIPETVAMEDPEGTARYIQNLTRAYGGRDFSPDEFRQFLREKNAASGPFFGQTPAGQSSSSMAGASPALRAAEASGIRESLYNALDPENEGWGPREIQRRTGTVKELEDAAQRRQNQITQEKPLTPAGAFGNILTGPVRMLKLGRPDLAFTAMGHPFIGPSDAIIRQLGREAPGAPPLPSADILSRIGSERQIEAPAQQMPAATCSTSAITRWLSRGRANSPPPAMNSSDAATPLLTYSRATAWARRRTMGVARDRRY